MSDIDPNKLKVVELRAELSNRGLDTKGNKAVLVKRLQTALNQARGTFTSEGDDNVSDDQSGLDSQDSMAEDSFVQEDKSDIQEKDEDAEQKEKCPDEEEELEKPVIEEEKPVEEDKADDKMEATEAEPEKVNGANEEVSVKEETAESNDVKNEEEKSEEIQIKEEPVEEQSDVKNEETPSLEPTVNEQQPKGEKRRRSRSPSSEHKNRSRSPSGERKRSRSKTPPKQEEEESFDDTIMTLDMYNSDLNLIIDKNRYTATPLTEDGFAFVWSGARATHGFRKGKICFEVKILKELDVSHLPSDEPNPHVVRVGVSTEDTSMQLGEEPQSYGYGGTGKASTNCQFKDYGAEFGAGDVIACFLNLDEEPMQISFSKNGSFQGIAYTIPHEQIGEKPLFPHVLSKNCSFEVNFGQKETPYFPIPEAFSDYMFCECIPVEDRVKGRKALLKREDCEMIMMCGLPGSGKSTWAANYCALHPDKNYNVLGTNNIIDKMKVMGLPRKRNYAGRWDVLIEKSTKCLNKLLEMASKVKRNFILDQTNVYGSAQRRKMRPFEGFKRRAVVLVPTDEEFRRRIAKREKEEGKDVPESAVLEMKANFILPEVGSIFDSVEYVELLESEARPLVDSYRKEGRAAMPPPEKRFKPNERNIPQRGGGRFGPPIQNRDRDRNRNDDRRYNSPSRGGYNPGGRGMNNNYPSYRDNRHQDRSGYNRGNRGPIGPNRPGMNRGGPPNRSGPPMSGGRGPPPPPPPHSNRSNYSSYNSRDRSYQSQSAKSDHKSSGQNQGYGQSGYGNSSYNPNYNYQTYSYGQPNYGQQQGYGQQQPAQQQQQQQQQQWKQSSNNYGSPNYATYSQQSYSQPQQQTSTYSQQQVQQQTQPTTTAAQSYYNQQYYNQQWSQWNQQNQQYYNQYYPYYNQGYATYGQQNSQPK